MRLGETKQRGTGQVWKEGRRLNWMRSSENGVIELLSLLANHVSSGAE